MRSVLRTTIVLATAGAALLLGPAPAGIATVPGAGQAPRAEPVLGRCGPGELCLWSKPDFKGTRLGYELSEVDIESCTPLPSGRSAQALANRLGRPVTTYQSATCAETGEFDTYPGDGTWTPRSPHRIRAFKVWEN
ncbi:peptidase inhibitor family I36 protein [Streptomyces sp. NPDC002490]|uniref:peptidase inhibitor family I36 protein n=1 Tax=Streptomyces sp. NPDC002490 TaxID=3154416 RepID=UPI00331F4BFA